MSTAKPVFIPPITTKQNELDIFAYVIYLLSINQITVCETIFSKWETNFTQGEKYGKQLKV